MGYPALQNAPYSFKFGLISQADSDIFQVNPTLVAGDVVVCQDDGAFSNIAALPTQSDADGVLNVELTAAEMNGDLVAVFFHDVAGDEWRDNLALIGTGDQQIDDIPTAAAIAQAVWSLATRSLPQEAATIGTQLTAAEATGTLLIRKFSYYVYGLTKLGDLTDRTSMVLTIKHGPTQIEDDMDSNDLEAILQIEEGIGVVVLNGRTTGFAVDGASLVVDDEDTGAITIAIEDATSGLLPAGNYQYDIKKLMVDGTSLVRESGRVKILAGTTKRVV